MAKAREFDATTLPPSIVQKGHSGSIRHSTQTWAMNAAVGNERGQSFGSPRRQFPLNFGATGVTIETVTQREKGLQRDGKLFSARQDVRARPGQQGHQGCGLP